jgi:sugar phosphate isomerase/epimerase
MRIRTPKDRPALLTYCANVHAGEALSDVLEMAGRFAGPVRRRLQVEEMGLGLWLGRAALSELRGEGLGRLREALAGQGLFAFTMNGFPYGDFQAAVVKRRVYHPDAGTAERRAYLLELAEALCALLPDDLEAGTISTLPLGHRQEADAGLEARALDQLCGLAADLARLRERTGKSVRVCLEPEPGCLLETTPEAVRFFSEALPAAARRNGVEDEVWREHLGLCFDACHQAVAFEDSAAALRSLRAAGVAVGKAQLSTALVVNTPHTAEAQRRLAGFDEPRFLHQVRARGDDGRLAAADDLPQAGDLPRDRPWRIHFHLPVHRGLEGELGTTRDSLEAALAELRTWDTVPHLEVETYTWSVLPVGERPRDDAGLVAGIAEELRWVRERVARP